MFTVVAGERSPSKVPSIESFVPASVAVTEPEPATVAAIVASIGTGDSLALYVLPLCAKTESPSDSIAAPIAAAVNPRVIDIAISPSGFEPFHEPVHRRALARPSGPTVMKAWKL
jgi:hypothetical protein